MPPASSQNEESTENDNTENQIVFEEVVAIDNAECAVKITEIDPDNMWGYTLKAQLENKSTEKTYMFSVESASINGVQCDPMFASEVAAGKKANEEINFSTDTLEENGIVEFWEKSERLLLTALIAYLHYEAPVEEQNFATLLEMLNTMQVLEDDEEYQNPVDLLFEELAKKKPNSFAGRQYKLYKLAAGDICSK